MRFLRYLLLTGVVGVLCSCGQRSEKAVATAKVSSNAKEAAAAETPVTVETAKAGGNAEFSGVSGADNSRCHVCHANFAEEKLSLVHEQAGVGCQKCHGMSEAHCADEDNVTAPDIMYAKEKIDSACMGCHARSGIDSEPHRAFWVPAASDKKYCTDCHGEHRMSYRTRRWDKNTGRLMKDDKVRMMTDDMLK